MYYEIKLPEKLYLTVSNQWGYRQTDYAVRVPAGAWCLPSKDVLEIFYAMQEELRFFLKRIQLLENILTENSIPIPEYEG